MSEKTIGQLASTLDVSPREVGKKAKELFKISAKEAKDWNHPLSQHQCKQITAFFVPTASAASDLPTEITPSSDPEQNQLPRTRLDPPSEFGSLVFGALNHNLWVHQDAWGAAADKGHIRKRVSLVLQHLGANGWPTVVKGCRDDTNKGWLRSPLGGQNGMQYYLWWAPKGNRPVKNFEIADGDIVVRAIRHHDDHAPLDAGNISDYLAFKHREMEDDGYFEKPWTDDQLLFVEANDPVRLILGRPGSGKTTVLWKALESRGDQDVLYLTWSRNLTENAEKHFKAFAPVDVRVKPIDFAGFLGEICHRDIERLTLDQSHKAFNSLIDEIRTDGLGVWGGRQSALYAEIRAFLLGQAIPGEAVKVLPTGLIRLDDKAYLRRRGGADGIGAAAAENLLKIFRTIEDDPRLANIFPELVAASEAIEKLRNDNVAVGFSTFDRVVVDEVQDLTLLEATVVIELCRVIYRVRGYAPWLLIAGDDGQTVRPSGFEWGPLNDLIARRVGTPKKFQLEENLRCPDRIARVIERASAHYGRLDKGQRPTKQRHRVGGQHVDAHLIHVNIQNAPEAIELLDQLDEVEGMVVVSPSSDLPSWLPDHLRDRVLTPAETKGLEYQSVCVLDPGHVLAGLERGVTPLLPEKLGEHARRVVIDQLRVALSRATETLAFIDVEASEAERALSWELLGDPAPFDQEDLLERFANSDISPEEAVIARNNDARSLIDERPARAWRRSYQAVRLLGDPDLPNGIADAALRSTTEKTLLGVAARLLVDGVPNGVRRDEIIEVVGEVLQVVASPTQENAFKQLDSWTNDKSSAPFSLLEAVLEVDSTETWLNNALAPVAQSLRQAMEEHSHNAKSAVCFSRHVEGWLELTKYFGDVVPEARRLRCQAFDTLIAAREIESAENVLKIVEPEDSYRLGQLREAQGRAEDAANAFARAGATKDALRNWRGSGKWEKAIALADGSERADLEWLIDLENTVARIPSELSERLTERESGRVQGILARVVSSSGERTQRQRPRK